MTTARYPEVTDELLSAYLDNAVTDLERQRIETAAANDPEVAWRLASLRETVRLLHELPALVLPRSFVLTPEQLGHTPVEATLAGTVAAPLQRQTPVRAERPGFWGRLGERWWNFWQGGSPLLRNAMAASLAVLMVLLVAPRMLAPSTLPVTIQPTQAVDAAPMEPAAAKTAPLEPTTLESAPSAQDAIAQESVQSMAAPDADEPSSTASAEVAEVSAASPDIPDTNATVAAVSPTLPPIDAGGAAAASAAGVPNEALRGGPAAASHDRSQSLPFGPSGDALAGAASAQSAQTEGAAPAPGAQMPEEIPAPSQPAEVTESEGASEAIAAAAQSPGAEAMDVGAEAAMAAPADLPGAAIVAPTLAPTVAPATPIPTTMPSTPADLPPVASVAAVAAAEPAGEAELPRAAVASPPAATTGSTSGRLLPIIQLAAAVATLVFGFLWWRSRKA